jgi:hypothetical protein
MHPSALPIITQQQQAAVGAAGYIIAHISTSGMQHPACSMQHAVGDDSRFFALLGSAPQELNTARPEAKLTC